MKKETKPRKPWAIWLVVLAITAIMTWALVLQASAFTDPIEFISQLAIWAFAALAFTLVGGLVLANQPSHKVGRLMMIFPLMVAASVVLDHYLLEGVRQAQSLTTGQFLYLWFSGWSWCLLIGPVLLIFLYYPTGRVISPRWRWAMALIFFTFVLFIIGASFAPTIEPFDEGASWPNPIALMSQETTDLAFAFFTPLLLGSVVIAVSSVFVRYRHAKALERVQIKWLFFACIVFLIVYATGFVNSISEVGSLVFDALFSLSVAAIPLAIGIGILRYRLWDIDLVINRSLVFGVLTTLLAAIFAATASLAAQLAKSAFGEEMNQAAAAVAAIFVASIFQPLRTRVENAINHRLFPENVDLSEGLVEMNPDLWSWIGLPKILEATLHHLQDIYKFDQAAIYVSDGKNGFVPHAALGVPLKQLRTFIPSKAEVEQLLHKRGILKARGADFIVTVPLYLPRRSAPQIVGVLRLGKRPEGRGYSSDEVKTLVGFGSKLGQPLFAMRQKAR